MNTHPFPSLTDTPAKIKSSLGKGGVADSYVQMVKEAKMAATEQEKDMPTVSVWPV